MLQNAYFLAEIGADTAENERNSAENLPKIGGGRPLEEEGREAARRGAEVEEAQPGRVRDAAYDGREHSARVG